MDIKDILDSLGLDFSNPEVKRGAVEAIEAILSSRATMPDVGSMGGGNDRGHDGGQDNTTEVELDPDLLQPSIKQAPTGVDNTDIEIDDEENILDQIKHKESEEPIENTNSAGNDSNNRSGSDSEAPKEKNSEESAVQDDEELDNIDEIDSATSPNVDDKSTTNNVEKDESSTETAHTTDNDVADNDAATTEVNDEFVEDELEAASESEDEDTEDAGEKADFDVLDYDDEDVLDTAAGDVEESEQDTSDEESDFDEDDLIDDELKDSTEDEEIKTKHNARKIKRERTLAAAKKALADAQAKKISASLIRELEKAIEALETLTEGVAKSLKTISDAEFNQLVNRVFDAIQACGDSGLTFTSEEEREAKVKEIKDDLASVKTQTELSAEDIAKIRAETQAIKAREKENDKYTAKARESFKGFREFLNSLYRAIALQVHNEETQDSSWSAINRRYSGTGILQPGKKIQELPNKKIPVIDFYFDQSGSWTDDDIKVGEKAVQSLADMEANGQIKINVYYFSDDVFADAASARSMGGTRGWNEIVKNVIATQATNVIIMTDDDMENWWRPQRSPALKYTVPGYVWYLWKDGENAPRLPRDLKGRGGVQQFSFSASDI